MDPVTLHDLRCSCREQTHEGALLLWLCWVRMAAGTPKLSLWGPASLARALQLPEVAS